MRRPASPVPPSRRTRLRRRPRRNSGASAASGDPAPGTPAYLARDAQNIADAYGRQTAPGRPVVRPGSTGWRCAQYINPVFAADLRAAGGDADPSGAEPGDGRARAGTRQPAAARTGTAPAAG